jgi:hypothetical protein
MAVASLHSPEPCLSLSLSLEGFPNKILDALCHSWLVPSFQCRFVAKIFSQAQGAVCNFPRAAKLMEATRQTEEDQANAGGLSWYVCTILFLPLLYLLSVGPALKLRDARSLPDPIFQMVYTPLHYAERACPPLSRSVYWYAATVWRWRPFGCIY